MHVDGRSIHTTYASRNDTCARNYVRASRNVTRARNYIRARSYTRHDCNIRARRRGSDR